MKKKKREKDKILFKVDIIDNILKICKVSVMAENIQNICFHEEYYWNGLL